MAVVDPPLTVTLYMGDLHLDTTTKDLARVFRKFDPRVSVHLCREKLSNKSLCYAYVHLCLDYVASAALMVMNRMWRDKSRRIFWTQRDPVAPKKTTVSLYVEKLYPPITNGGLQEFFFKYRIRFTCKIAVKGKHISLGIGTVQFNKQSLLSPGEAIVCDLRFSRITKTILPKYIPPNPHFLPGRVPCILSSSTRRPFFEFFFPSSNRNYVVYDNLSQYTIAGQSIPDGRMWLLLVNQQERTVVLYNGRDVIQLPRVPRPLHGRLIGSLKGQPMRRCWVLIVQIIGYWVRPYIYNPHLNRWMSKPIACCHYVQRPMAPCTTAHHFWWVDAARGKLYSFNWDNPLGARLHSGHMEPEFVDAEMVSSVVWQGNLDCFVLRRDGEFKIFHLEQTMNPDDNDYESSEDNILMEGYNIYASAYGCGFKFPATFDQGQMLYLRSWGRGDCCKINLDGEQQRVQVMHPCYSPDPRGFCRCQGCFCLMDESFMQNLPHALPR